MRYVLPLLAFAALLGVSGCGSPSDEGADVKVAPEVAPSVLPNPAPASEAMPEPGAAVSTE